jgi:lipopolysaccharide export system permease protein
VTRTGAHRQGSQSAGGRHPAPAARIFRLPIIERYVIRQISIPLLTALGAGLSVLCAERIVQVLDITLGNRNSFGVVLELLAYWMPHYIGLAAPVALYLGLLFGFNKMSKDSELDAFLAAGVSLGRLTRPVSLVAFLLAVNAAAMFGWLQPYSLYAYRATVHTLANVDVFYLAEEGVFMQSGSRTFILDKLARRDNSFQRIFLYDDKAEKGSETITAQSGQLVDDPENRRPILRLYTGHRLEVKQPADLTTKNTPQAPLVGDFESADIAMGELQDAVFRERGRRVRELTLTELYSAMQEPGISAARMNALASQFHLRLALVALVMVLPFLALPYAIGQRRGNRAYRFAVALVLLVAFHEILQQGALLVRVRSVSPWLGIWLPFALFAGFAFWRYYVTCYKLPRPWLEPLLEDIADHARSAWHRIRPPRPQAGAQ